MNPNNHNNKSPKKIIGLIPAGGLANRIAPLPCSKELYPIGFRSVDQGQSFRPKVACHYLLEKMGVAGATMSYVILRKGKWDIPAYFGDGAMLDMHLAYLIMNLPFGVPFTLDQAFPFVHDALILFGFPDIIFQPNDAFTQLLSQQTKSKADIVLGLFVAHNPHKMDMVDIGTDGKLKKIEIKPLHTHLRYTWIIAAWTPTFTRFMHEYVSARQQTNLKDKTSGDYEEPKEIFLGDVIQAAIQNNLRIDKVFFTQGTYLDIGTPEDMAKAVQVTNYDTKGYI